MELSFHIDIDMFSVILAVLVGLLGWLFYAGTRRPRNFPPGPPRWPVVGSLFSMFPIEKGQPSLLSTHEHFRYGYGTAFLTSYVLVTV